MVKASTTREEKLNKLIDYGINPFKLLLGPHAEDGDWESFLTNEILIINIPPRIASLGSDFHIAQIKTLTEKIKSSQVNKIIYISSTSVYPDTNELTDEGSAIIDGNAMVVAENILAGLDIGLTVLRCGGMMGYDRVPGKYFAGKEIFNGGIPVNFVHRDDVIAACEFIIKNNVWYKCFNLVSPLHPLRKEIYVKNSIDFALNLPVFNTSKENNSYKVIIADKIINHGFNFLFPDPLDYYYEL